MGHEQLQMRGDAILGGPCEPHPRAHSPGVTSHLQAPHPPRRLSLSPEITGVRGTVRHPRAPVPRPREVTAAAGSQAPRRQHLPPGTCFPGLFGHLGLGLSCL